MTGELVRVRRDLEGERQMVESLKNMLASKSVQFEEEFINYRKEVMGEKRQKDMLKSIKNFADLEEPTPSEEPSAASIVVHEQPSTKSVRTLFKKVVNCGNPRSGKSRKFLEIHQNLEDSSANQEMQNGSGKIQAKTTQTDISVSTYSRGVNTVVGWDELMKTAEQDSSPRNSPKKQQKTELYAHVNSRVYAPAKENQM